jgi:prepilin-type N-terminal cleavage/methylation domain-containing protein
MKLSPSNPDSLPARSRRDERAFTLPEIMSVMAIFLLLVMALVSSQLFGLRMSRITEARLTSTDNSRKVLSRIRADILMSRTLVVGNGDVRSFTPIPNNAPRIGNALEIYSTADTNIFVRYFLNTNGALERWTNAAPASEVLARSITNLLVFQAEDFQGQVQTNDQNSRVIRMNLEFRQREYPLAAAGPNGMTDYYRLQTRLTRRIVE